MKFEKESTDCVNKVYSVENTIFRIQGIFVFRKKNHRYILNSRNTWMVWDRYFSAITLSENEKENQREKENRSEFLLSICAKICSLVCSALESIQLNLDRRYKFAFHLCETFHSVCGDVIWFWLKIAAPRNEIDECKFRRCTCVRALWRSKSNRAIRTIMCYSVCCNAAAAAMCIDQFYY